MHVERFLEECEEKSYLIYKNDLAPYNLNIIGWRNRDIVVDHFNDFISVYWFYEGRWFGKSWSATTLPGAPWLFKPINTKGTAILVPGQYLGVYELGKYKGYTALKQTGPIKVYRDNDRDSAWDMNPETIEEGVFGVHIHRAGKIERNIGFWSAGCQVFERTEDFNEFIELCELANGIWGNRFSYTLLEF